jgi:hypothetical protein
VEEDFHFGVDGWRRWCLDEQAAGAQVLKLNLDGEPVDLAVERELAARRAGSAAAASRDDRCRLARR